jgi:hypothetical protein
MASLEHRPRHSDLVFSIFPMPQSLKSIAFGFLIEAKDTSLPEIDLPITILAFSSSP